MSHPEPQTEPDYPFPPRYWWLKRISRWSALVIVLFIATMFWWRIEARRRLDAQVAALRARGEAVFVTDLPVGHVPNGQNAATTLKSAAAAIALTRPQRSFIENVYYILDAPLTPADRTMLQQIAAANANALQLVRLARSQPQADWDIAAGPVSSTAVYSRIGPQYNLTNLLWAMVAYQHEAGNNPEAIQLQHDLLHQGDALENSAAGSLGHLYAGSARTAAFESIRSMSYDLTDGPGQLPRQELQDLIPELLDDHVDTEGFRNALRREPISYYDVAANSKTYLGNAAIDYRLLEPIIYLNTAENLNKSNALLQAGTMRDYQHARDAQPSTLAAFELQKTIPSRLSHSVMTYPAYERFIQNHFAIIAQRRVAAIRLSIVLYRRDHQGNLPPTLDALVPDYLPSLPLDPFAATPRSFGYRFAPRPMIYSVGTNGKDENGNTSLNYPGVMSWHGVTPGNPAPGDPGDNRAMDRADYIFPLHRPAPTTNGN